MAQRQSNKEAGVSPLLLNRGVTVRVSSSGPDDRTLDAMLHTPADFLPMQVPDRAAGAWTFVCRGDKLLLREADLSLPEPALLASKAAEQALRQSQEELRRLGAHQERIKEEERKRIAQEIHDELGGLLTGIRAYILVAQERAVAAGREPEPLLADTADLVQTAIETVRRVITDLRPSVLDQLGVWAALEWYAGQVALRAGLRCDCSIDAQVAALELDAERSTMLFRVVQEALTNVVRHAGASAARAGCG
eukprot:gene36351-44846_t